MGERTRISKGLKPRGKPSPAFTIFSPLPPARFPVRVVADPVSVRASVKGRLSVEDKVKHLCGRLLFHFQPNPSGIET
ncbi:MAG: hypothetical protein GXO13_01770 [Epsilonproteobacteria bacterium]|nr:hypothetical protein [Campylobacterota bacterium]